MKWDYIADVESMTEPGKQYEIKRHPPTGRYGCSCPSYRFAPAHMKRCKHIEAFLAGEAQVGRAPLDRQQQTSITIALGSERFRVRRTIALSAIPGVVS